AQTQTEHVRRWIDQPETAIQVQRVAGTPRLETLRQDNLKGIACNDVPLRGFNGSFKAFPRHVTLRVGRRTFSLCVDVRQLAGKQQTLQSRTYQSFRGRINLLI